MTFGRWLLVHSFSICIVIMLGIAYVYKDELRLKQAYQQLLQVEPDKIILAEKPKTVDEAAANTKNIHTPSEKQTTNNNLNHQSQNAALAKNLPVMGTMSGSEESQLGSVKFIDEKKAKELEESVHLANLPDKDKEKMINSTEFVEKPSIKVNKPNIGNYQELVAKAREAYWKKNFPLSIELYIKAIELSPQQGDLYGELGNVFYGLNNIEAAGKYYLKSGEIFLQQNQHDRAKDVYDLLRKVSPSLADQLLVKKQQFDSQN